MSSWDSGSLHESAEAILMYDEQEAAKLEYKYIITHLAAFGNVERTTWETGANRVLDLSKYFKYFEHAAAALEAGDPEAIVVIIEDLGFDA